MFGEVRSNEWSSWQRPRVLHQFLTPSPSSLEGLRLGASIKFLTISNWLGERKYKRKEWMKTEKNSGTCQLELEDLNSGSYTVQHGNTLNYVICLFVITSFIGVK